MAIAAVPPSTSTTAQASTTSTGLAGISTADFLNLFITQLQNQDPLNPTDSNDFLTQTAEFSEVQGITQLNQNVSQLLSSQQLTQAAALIGQTVTYQPASGGSTQSGTVSAVSMLNGQAQLTIGSSSVPLTQVVSIQ